MKKFIFGLFMGLALAAFTGCTNNNTIDRTGMHCE
jgi:hypothetical protein